MPKTIKKTPAIFETNIRLCAVSFDRIFFAA
jgi:hypothetical protein